MGASLRPLTHTADGQFDWFFKVMFKSPEDVEVFYDVSSVKKKACASSNVTYLSACSATLWTGRCHPSYSTVMFAAPNICMKYDATIKLIIS